MVLERLLAGLDAIGADRAAAWRVVVKAALDSVPALRLAAVDALHRAGRMATPEVAKAVHHPTNTTRRALEDLAAHSVVLRHTSGPGKADEWELSEFTAAHYGRAVAPATVPAKSSSAHSGNKKSQAESGFPHSQAPLTALPEVAGTHLPGPGEEPVT